MEVKRHVRHRLLFAKRRLDELTRLGGPEGDLGTVSEVERQQPLQEFFFHLVGAIEFLSQNVNDTRGRLITDEEDVTPGAVCQRLPAGDTIRTTLSKLHPKTRSEPLPEDPYSEDACSPHDHRSYR